MRLAAIASLVIDSDMPAVEKVSYATVEKTKKLLAIIAQNVPLVPNISKLGQALESTRDSCLKMLYTLDKAQIISLLTKDEPNSFLAVDDIETGTGNRIPLWMFGLLY